MQVVLQDVYTLSHSATSCKIPLSVFQTTMHRQPSCLTLPKANLSQQGRTPVGCIRFFYPGNLRKTYSQSSPVQRHSRSGRRQEQISEFPPMLSQRNEAWRRELSTLSVSSSNQGVRWTKLGARNQQRTYKPSQAFDQTDALIPVDC